MKMFAVVPDEYKEDACVKLMSHSRKGAIALWEHWDPDVSFKDVSGKHSWKVKSYDVNLLKR